MSLACQGSMVQAQGGCHSLSSLGPHNRDICEESPWLLMGYRYHITTPEGLMTTLKLLSLLRPLMMSPVKTFWPCIEEVYIIIKANVRTAAIQRGCPQKRLEACTSACLC